MPRGHAVDEKPRVDIFPHDIRLIGIEIFRFATCTGNGLNK